MHRADLALRVAAAEPLVSAVALLSVGLDYRGVTTEDALAVYGDRPLLIVAGLNDAYSADSSQTLAEAAQSPAIQLVLLEDAGHGTVMLERTDGELTALILDWLALR